MSDLYELNMRLIQASDDLTTALEALNAQVQAFARAEHQYRSAKARGFLAVVGAKNVAEREALAESSISPDPITGEALTLGDLRYRRDLAEGLKLSALEAVRSRRGQLSAVQTLASLSKAEAEFARTGP